MVMFNSYLTLPEGMPSYIPSESHLNPIRVQCCWWLNYQSQGHAAHPGLGGSFNDLGLEESPLLQDS